MDEIIKIWDIIVKSNTFNFAILLLMLAIVLNKLDIKNKLEALKKEITNKIEQAQQQKEDAAKILSNARSDVEHLEEEVAQRLEQAKNNAQTITAEILKNAGEKAKKIEDGISRRIDAEEKAVSALLSKQTAIAAVELAKDFIIKNLDNNTELHKKFINESIEELDRINI